MAAIPKEKPFRSAKYRKRIRNLDCVSCGWPSFLGEIECHHVETNGTGTKCGDDLTVPLCSPNARGCHARADKTPASVEKYLPIAKSLFREWTEFENS